MSMSDPISDMLTRIRNAQSSGKLSVTMQLSKMKKAIAEVLCSEGYINNYEIIENGTLKQLNIFLKYYLGKPVIEKINRISKPGLRKYCGKEKLPRVDGGMGIAIISTSKGVMSDQRARGLGEGGEVLCYVS